MNTRKKLLDTLQYASAIMHCIMYTVYRLGSDSTEIVINHDELHKLRSSDFTPGHIRSAKTQNPPVAAGVRFIFSSRINVSNNIVAGLGSRIVKGNKGIGFDMARSKEGNKMLVVTELTEIASWRGSRLTSTLQLFVVIVEDRMIC